MRLQKVSLVLCWILLMALSGTTQQQTRCASGKKFSPETLPLRYDFHAEMGKEATATIANNYTAPLTGVVSELTMADGTSRAFVWDAYDRNMEPAPPSGTMVQSFPPPRGGLPKGKLVAALWADGATFGDEANVGKILSSRSVIVEGYGRLAKTLASGLQKRWTREQYLAAIEADEEKAGSEKQTPELHRAAILPHGALRGMLSDGLMQRGRPAPLAFAVKKAIAYCEQQRQQLSAGNCAAGSV